MVNILERLSIEINAHNVDMMAQAHGTLVGGRLPTMISVLGVVDAPIQYKDLYVCKAYSVKESPVFPKDESESLIFNDCFASYVDKILHQKKRNYFLIRKDLEKDELKTLTRAAIYSNIEQVKKTESYYCDLLEVARATFRDKYENTLELFCRLIDNELHKIEKKMREML